MAYEKNVSGIKILIGYSSSKKMQICQPCQMMISTKTWMAHVNPFNTDAVVVEIVQNVWKY